MKTLSSWVFSNNHLGKKPEAVPVFKICAISDWQHPPAGQG
ncbi:hypothetical protein AB434_0723 [Heyndrickxia coagulans]|uniref:Uncharacterized protein n=1 Tax=Heyndrickxia coagulans TaxID=1398 RepID=A0AAN0WAT1_HEYCO|nr:hypothetical protein SB48_HM08orf00686 [Heyndrickxia coagulans]AKN53128.1 hypothetical protein AB434_0723 [Heyndrickxia coagulans]KYC63683.1 hypothetical protein B4100_1799 [Heyndrickxia coagulans]